MFLLVPAYPGCPGSKAVKRSLSLLLYRLTQVVLEKRPLSACGSSSSCEYAVNCACLCSARCNVVSQFNDGLYDIIVAADERSLDDPKSVNTDSSTNKNKLVHRLAVNLPKWMPLKWITH